MTVKSITHHYYIINLSLNLNDVNFKNAYLQEKNTERNKIIIMILIIIIIIMIIAIRIKIIIIIIIIIIIVIIILMVMMMITDSNKIQK